MDHEQFQEWLSGIDHLSPAQRQQAAIEMDFANITDDVKRVFPVARSLRRKNSDLFQKFIRNGQLREDNAFYPALAQMVSGKGISAIQEFDRRLLERNNRNERKTFLYRACRSLNNYANENRISEDEVLSHDFPPASFENMIQTLIYSLCGEGDVTDCEADTSAAEKCIDAKEPEDWKTLARSIATQSNALTAPDPELARQILELAEWLVSECERDARAEEERAALTMRRQDLFQRLSALDGDRGGRLGENLDNEQLDKILYRLTKLEGAKEELEKAESELQLLRNKARDALEGDDLDAEARLMKLRRAARSHVTELSDRSAAARTALEELLQFAIVECVDQAKRVEVADAQLEREPPQLVEPPLGSPSGPEAVTQDEEPSQKGGSAEARLPHSTELVQESEQKPVVEEKGATDRETERVSTELNKESENEEETVSVQLGEEVEGKDRTTECELGDQSAQSSDHSSHAFLEEGISDPLLEANADEMSKVLARFLERGELSFAWHYARLQEERSKTPAAVPAAVLWALMLLRSVRSAEDVADKLRSGAMADMMAALPAAFDKTAACRLALAALLRPALFDPFYGARNQLQNLPRENGLDDAAPLIDALAALGHEISFSEETLSYLAGARCHDRSQEMCEKLKHWLENARRRKTVHQPTFTIFHRELSSDGRVGNVLEAAIANAPQANRSVDAFLKKLDNNGLEQVAFVTEAESRSGRPRRDRIKGMALAWFCRYLQEACDLLREWSNARNEQAIVAQDRQRDVLTRAIGAIRGAIPEQRANGTSTAGHLEDAANSVLWQSYEDLRGLLDGSGKVEAPRRLREISETPLLRLPGGCQDWTDVDDLAFAEERKRRDRRLLLALSQSERIAENYREAFQHRLKERAILASKSIVDLMQGAGLTSDEECDEYRQTLEEYRQTLEEESAAARHTARDKAERLRQAFATISYLDLESADEVRDILTQLSAITDALSVDINMGDITLPALSGARMATVPPDFPELDEVLEEFENQRVRLTATIADRQKLSLEALCEGPLGRSAKAILAEMERLDPVTVDDAIAELSADRDVPLPEVDASDEFESFFPDFVKSLDDANNDELARGRVINALQEGTSTGPIDFSNLEDTEHRRARRLLEIWGTLDNAMKQIRTDRIQRIQMALEDLFSDLGFTGVRLADMQEDTPGKLCQLKIKCNQVRPDGWFLPPAFGSVAEGHYRGAVVRSDISTGRILSVIGGNAPDQPWVVVFLRKLNLQERQEFAQKAHQDARQVLFLDETLLYHLAVKGEDPLAGLFACALPFGWVQPYVTRAGAIPTEMFFGRQEEISRILARDGGGCLIYGGRQLGKSALLNHIHHTERHRPNSGVLAIYLDIKPVGGIGMAPERIWNELYHELETNPDIGSVPQDASGLVRAIEAWLKEDPSRRLLAMFDEADNFLRAEHAGGYLNLQKLKGLMERTGMRFKAVFAGLHNVRRMAQAPNSPLPHLGEPICIGPMNQTRENRAALRRLATEPMHAAGLDYGDPGLASDMIARMNYYPSLVQVFCRQIVETIGRKAFTGKKGPRRRLSRKELFEGWAAEQAAEQIRERFQLTLNLDVRYECIAKSLALHRLQTSSGDTEVLSKGLSARELLELELTHAFWPRSLGQPSVSDIEELLKEMVDLGVLSDFGRNCYGLRSALVAQMLGTRDRLENDLLLLNEREMEPAYDAAEFHSLLRPYRPTERAPLADRKLERLFDSENPGLRLVVGRSALAGPDIGKRIKVAADIWRDLNNRDLNNTLVSPNERELRHAIDGFGKHPAVLVIDGDWNAKIAENLARQQSIVSGQVLPVWCLEQEPDALPENVPVYHSQTWSDGMVRHWLVDESLAPILDESECLWAILKASGGAPARLDLLLPLLKEIVARPETNVGDQLHEWTEETPISLDDFGVNAEDSEFLRDLSELGEAITSRDEMQRELDLASEVRILKLAKLGLLHDSGLRDQIPTVSALGLLLVE